MGNAERADVVVDFSAVPAGTDLYLINEGPDEPFGGGTPGVDFAPADPTTTGQVMKFRVVSAVGSSDHSTPPDQLSLPTIVPLGAAGNMRRVTLNEEAFMPLDIPVEAKLGTADAGPLAWMDPVTENPGKGTTEVWEIQNNTADAHPIHIHQVQFQVISRQPFGGLEREPEAWETGFKDTVITYPGEFTRLKARFDIAGRFVWHCHIVEHEDNEMMRPYEVTGTPAPLPPMPMPSNLG
jgi:bilirubin oxidase